MMFKLCVVSFLVHFLTETTHCAFPNVYGRFKQEEITDDPGVPLFLTPYIEQNKIQVAQRIARVYFNGFKDITSYSGYLTVNKAYQSNLFFWFFPSLGDYANDPVILWLQGGPGATSLIGLFGENGPFSVMSKHGLKLRQYAWTNSHSVIYIDNPVGTGYSFTNDGYAQNETQVGLDLYNALQQFFTMFPDLQKNEFYVAGESYAGKYVPAIAYTIYKNNPSAKLKINLQGLSIGNGFTDPENQVNYGDYLYQLGLIDANTRQTFQNYEDQGIKYIQNKQFAEAFKVFDSLLDGDLNNHNSLFKNVTGFDSYYDFLNTVDPSDELQYMAKYIQRDDIRATIHVGNSTFHTDSTVEQNLMLDVMQSVAPWVSELLSNYRVLLYNGQLDIIVAYPLTVNYLQNLKFSGSDEYKTAPRYKWYVGTDLAGYVKQAGNLTEVLVRDAGHMVPSDQPRWAVDLITRFTRNKPFHSESYAGKYVPAISYTIYKKNPSAKLKINLQGLSIGNGLSDPEHQLKYSDYLYQIGLIDSNTKLTVQNYEAQGIKYIQNKEFAKAFQIFDTLLNGDLNNHTSLFKNVTGFNNYFNFLYPETPSKELDYMVKYVQRTDIRAAIHVGNSTFHSEDQTVELNLVSDVMQSVAPWISELLSNYRVLIYNGQLDIIVAYPLTINYLQNLKFSGSDEYKTAPRYQWHVGTDLAGYVKQAGNLTEVLVRDAGHMVPADQPQWAVDLITRFTRNKPFHKMA